VNEEIRGAFRAEVERVLASPEFASSRQLQDFLRYSGDKALAGETHLEQADIASVVLGRDGSFNPIEDSSVRKLASLARKRLDQYYQRTGVPADGRVMLPLRSYLPQFESARAAVEAEVPTRRWRWLWVVAAGALVVVVSAVGVFWARRSPVAMPIRFELTTTRGDLMPRLDAPPEAIRLGPKLLAFDQVTAKLKFSPSQEAHQAGILVWDGPQRFVKFGRRFLGRNQIDLLAVWDGATAYQKFAYDPEGQSGQPLWLALRRNQQSFSAYTSTDGLRWEPWGEPFAAPAPRREARAGVYAFHGRWEATPATAAFEEVSTGVDFALEQDSDRAEMLGGGWSHVSSCPDAATSAIQPPALLLGFTRAASNCNLEIYRPLSNPAEWQVETRLDYLPMPGFSAGLTVRGSKSRIRVVRYFLNGPSIAFIHDAVTLVGVPDWNGSPPAILRLSARDGQVTGSVSADGEQWRPLPLRVPLSALGEKLSAGVRITSNSVEAAEGPQTARFYWFREAVMLLTPYR
jgi:hypothetical protein